MAHGPPLRAGNLLSRMRPRRLLTGLTCALAIVASGCGVEEVTTEADTEGIWVDVGQLDYHVQGSRQLNPFQVPDDRYLTGLPEGYGDPDATQTWFAIFLRVENKTDEPALSAEEFEIEDTQGVRYQPVPLDTSVNPYAYAPTELDAKDNIPHPDSSAEGSSTDGSMLLFKLPLEGYQNRPLEFIVHAPEGSEGPEEALLDLDV